MDKEYQKRYSKVDNAYEDAVSDADQDYDELIEQAEGYLEERISKAEEALEKQKNRHKSLGCSNRIKGKTKNWCAGCIPVFLVIL